MLRDAIVIGRRQVHFRQLPVHQCGKGAIVEDESPVDKALNQGNNSLISDFILGPTEFVGTALPPVDIRTPHLERVAQRTKRDAAGMSKMGELDLIREELWTKTDETRDPHILLEQYKLYVASAEGISQRRHAANTFFLTFNTALIGALAGFFQSIKDAEIVASFYAAALAFCFSWVLILRSYRNINTAKFKVIAVMEEILPASPFWRAEWTSLGKGKDYSKYIPLSLVETAAPIIFGAIYLFLLVRVF